MKGTKIFHNNFTHYKCFILCIIFLFLIQSCKENQTTEFGNIFSGITNTDENGNILSSDSDDWKNDYNWEYNGIYLSQKDSIEVFPPPQSQTDVYPSNFYVYPAYPNPVSSGCNIEFGLPTFCEVFIIIINQSNNIIAKLMLRYTSGVHVIRFDGSSLNNDTYRCIYRFEDKLTGEYGIFNGHGDIQIVK
ncbi:MAG: hypothetical protein A2V66_08140 [Ignavibacteria bacterium RBG_13_36_8]|nr:MAG: hypothetical protein A2V66_08140 [Ignavibacteria bacterium RBG_13_36_8]